MKQSHRERRILVFSQMPPPHHGQSFMMKQFVDYFDWRQHRAGVACWNVNARLSDEQKEIGRWRLRKPIRLLRYCREAASLQRQHGLDTLLIVPAPGKYGAVLRDWVIAAFLRRRFKYLVLYWHASGLGEWLNSRRDTVAQRLTLKLLGRPDLSIILSRQQEAESEAMLSRRTRVVPNFIPDPAPPDIETIIEAREERARLRRLRLCGGGKTGEITGALEVQVLYLSSCRRSKGLFDTLDGVALANRRLRENGIGMEVKLVVAGAFASKGEEEEFWNRLGEHGLAADDGRALVEYIGFADSQKKAELIGRADFLCFPTYYPAESFGLVVVEALAFGLPVIATRWRALPELLPDDYSLFVAERAPDAIADILTSNGELPDMKFLRRYYLKHYVDHVGLGRLHRVLGELVD